MSFLRDMLPIIFFFFILDTLTTILALQVGREANPLIAWGIYTYGLVFLVIIKVLAVPAFYACYRLHNSRIAWNISRYSVAAVGLIVSVSNVWVYVYGISFFQLAGVV
jgi:hypothetical protein